MAKAKSCVEAVNIVSKDKTLGFASGQHRRMIETADEGLLPQPQSSKHSQYQTLEELLYSLDSKAKSAKQLEEPKTKEDHDAVTEIAAIASVKTDKDDIVCKSPARHQDNDEEIETLSGCSSNRKGKHPEELMEQSDDVEGKKSELKDSDLLDLKAFLNDDSDIEDTVSIEDLQTRRRLLDYQLQRRLEQYYLDDLDIDSLTVDDLAVDFGILSSRNSQPAKPDFPQSVECEDECRICFEVLMIQKRWCCDFPVCNSCMDQYLEVKVNQGVVKIFCINGSCSSYIHREEIYNRLEQEMKDKFYRFLVNANQDPHIKTCPKCSHVYNETELGSDNRHKFGQLVVCPECKLTWCFKCHAPWHFGVKCKEFQKGDKLVKHWAKEQHFGVNNAQKCPKCKVFIERKGGCDHMTCIRCNTGFCYRCGGRYRDLKFFGNHLSCYSIVGCKYNYMPNHPFARRLCRGSIFGAELLGGIVLLGLGIAAAGLLLGASVIILPAFGGYKYHKRRKIRQRMRIQEELFKMRTQNALMEMQRERAVLERYTEKLHQQTDLTDSDVGPVHVGIQTDQSQKVDVTVHSPAVAKSVSKDEQTIDSQIRMNISDERGQVTVTTAEITHNTSKGDGSEAEVVLHVRTTYANVNNENGLEADNEREIPSKTDSEDWTENEKDLSKDMLTDSDSKDEPAEESLHSNMFIKGSSSENSTLSLPHTKHNRTASLPGKSDSLKSKDSIKFNFGKPHLRRSDRVRKQGRSKDSKTSMTDSHGTETGKDQDQGEALPKNNEMSDEKTSDEQDENLDNEALSQSGCFLKLFSRKLNTLQNQLGKDREKISLTRSLSEPIDYTTCPDLVSCIIASELKNREAKEEVKLQDKEPALGPEAEGVVAKETCSTSF